MFDRLGRFGPVRVLPNVIGSVHNGVCTKTWSPSAFFESSLPPHDFSTDKNVPIQRPLCPLCSARVKPRTPDTLNFERHLQICSRNQRPNRSKPSHNIAEHTRHGAHKQAQHDSELLFNLFQRRSTAIRNKRTVGSLGRGHLREISILS
jgi:hypothetical protein